MWDVQGPVLVDETGAYAADLGIRGVPTNVLVNEDGIVRTVGAATPQELQQAVSALMRK